jgi:hypothetical protein
LSSEQSGQLHGPAAAPSIVVSSLPTDEVLVFRRSTLLLPAVVAALALPVSPALAGEDDGSASLDMVRSCVHAQRAKLAVSGPEIDSVAFYLDGRRVKSVTSPAATGRYVFSMPCSRLSVGAHRGRAVVTSDEGDNQTLRFQITRAAHGAPRFTG